MSHMAPNVTYAAYTLLAAMPGHSAAPANSTNATSENFGIQRIIAKDQTGTSATTE